MRRIGLITAVTCASAGFAGAASANTLKAGPSEQYTTPCAAIAAAQPNDVVEIDAGTYTDTCAITVAGLTVRGVGGQPKIDLSGTNHPADYKGIYVIDAENVTIENLELTGAHIDDSEGANGAGIRVEASGLVVHGCYIHDNQDGILGSPATAGTGTVTVEYTEFARDGMGDGCTNVACTHNVYLGEWSKVIFQFNWTHSIATDTPDKGHLLKSRADETDILYNRITGESGFDSYEVDLPQGGLGILVGNMIEKGPQAGNQVLVNYGEEGLKNADTRLFMANNTLVNDLGKGTFISIASGATLTAHDNLLVGAGTPFGQGTLPADNLAGVDPMFVNQAAFDYHLQAGSPAIGKAVDPGMAGSFSLTPVFEYVQPLLGVARLSDHDVGAFEYGTNVTGATMDGGAESPDGAVSSGGGDAGASSGGSSGGSGSSSGGGGTGDDGGSDPGSSSGGGSGSGSSSGGNQDAPQSSSGCGCTSAGGGAGGALGAGLAMAALALAAARRRRSRRLT